MKFCVLLVCAALMPFCVKAQQAKEVSPYIDLVFCPARAEPWSCARQQSGRILDLWNDQLDSEWQKLKVEADQQVNATLERRGYSSSEPVTKEKPSTILKKIEIGTSYMKDYLKETFDGFLGREYGYEVAQDDEEEKASDELADAEVTRGKKKKKKRAIMKLVLLGTFIKAKIELLLKVLGAHLQVKFLAIAVVGLLINIIRFWVDLKRGGAPQKVVYVEHAHHQHHYEDHGDEWSDQSGGYWKRSIETDPAIEDTVGTYQVPAIDPHYLAYRSQVL